MTESQEAQQFLSTQGIEWKFITPYAPWKGGFYERLIQSVKNAMYKAIRNKRLDFETMRTFLVEIEACLNTRPLTYMETDLEDRPTIRPIDFIQKDIRLAYPLDLLEKEQEQDDDYRPPEDLVQLRTRTQAIEALNSSHQLTQKFWKIWQTNYLMELRAHHQKGLKQGRSTTAIPRIGQVVLVMDSNLPRNAWSMGRITTINSSREVELLSSKGRTIKRPINLLVPLELEDHSEEEGTPPS